MQNLKNGKNEYYAQDDQNQHYGINVQKHRRYPPNDRALRDFHAYARAEEAKRRNHTDDKNQRIIQKEGYGSRNKGG
jgi:hypothetical protein